MDGFFKKWAPRPIDLSNQRGLLRKTVWKGNNTRHNSLDDSMHSTNSSNGRSRSGSIRHIDNNNRLLRPTHSSAQMPSEYVKQDVPIIPRSSLLKTSVHHPASPAAPLNHKHRAVSFSDDLDKTVSIRSTVSTESKRGQYEPVNLLNQHQNSAKKKDEEENVFAALAKAGRI